MQLINARMGINKIDEVIVTRSREQILNKIRDMVTQDPTPMQKIQLIG